MTTEFTQILLILLPPLILSFYTAYSYGRLVGYRLAVDDRNPHPSQPASTD